MRSIVASMTVGHEINYHPARVAIRLRAIMAHFGVSKSAFARSIGVTPGAVGNWLSEGHCPKNANIDKIYEVYGVVGEWTLFGRAFALSDDLRGPLTKAEDLIRRSAFHGKSAK